MKQKPAAQVSKGSARSARTTIQQKLQGSHHKGHVRDILYAKVHTKQQQRYVPAGCRLQLYLR